MDQLATTAFRVLDRPYVIWSFNGVAENLEFLNSIDSNFYHRTVALIFGDSLGNSDFDLDDGEARKDVASLARLLWNHGLETLVTLLGAFVQAPHAVHGFFLKCDNRDCRKIARYLVTGDLPSDHCLFGSDFDLTQFIRGVHKYAGSIADDITMANFTRALHSMLLAYNREDHRAEYNSIKHGLRAHHGRFAVAVGLQEGPGQPAPKENMNLLSSLPDGSHFMTAQPISGSTKKESREQFSIKRNSVGWSLQKTVFEIQLLSIIIGNVVSHLKIHAGVKNDSVMFSRPDVSPEIWQDYFADDSSTITNFSFDTVIDPPERRTDAEAAAKRYYKMLRLHSSTTATTSETD